LHFYLNVLMKRFMKKYSKEDQKLLATWAADCAERVLGIFEEAHAEDDRPRKAIEVCRKWVRTGLFKMAEIRGASLAAHAAARKAKGNDAACFAARAAGQAVATAHVPQHALGGAYYALKAVLAAAGENGEVQLAKEQKWQSRRLAKTLREEVLSRIIVEKREKGIFIGIRKGKDF
jgi:hypothetical protein